MKSPSPPWVEPLLRWYGAHRRAMPWREHPTPYRVWVSEIMLQQTRVDTVIPYYRRFLRRFPSLSALARADLQDVLKAWEGLGYYARARHLHAAARRVCEAHNRRLPRTAAELAGLPGIGAYTAAAIASICFGEPVPVVDGNVLRVFTRFWCVAGDIRLPQTRTRIAGRLQRAISGAPPSDFNQAIMELGALVCAPRTPACADCPLGRRCRARRAGRVLQFPHKARAPQPPHRQAVAAVIQQEQRILVCRRRDRRLLGGLWELPWGLVEQGETPARAAARVAREEAGMGVTVGAAGPAIDHAFSHFSMTLTPFACLPAGPPAPPAAPAAESRWVSVEELRALPLSRAHRRLAENLSP